MKPRPITKASPGTTCSYRWLRNSSAYRNSASILRTPDTSRDGRFTQNSSARKLGFIRDPVSDYGRLSSELFRAVRLVVDTGIHSEGWSRDQVVAFFRQSGAIDEPTIQAETDRYISWPAQALSYKLGQLKFRELRDRAQKELGPKFDIRDFHDEMLSGGVLPLDLLDSRTNSWIRGLKLGADIRGSQLT